MANSPYFKRPKRSFWKTGVVRYGGSCPSDIYIKKWNILPSDKVATAGSCFAQHIGRNLSVNGFNVIDAEDPPAALGKEKAKDFGYNLYSARYGNIYTSRQLLQLAQEVYGLRDIPCIAWKNDAGKFFDAFRPSVEPAGLDSEDEVRRHREFHVERVREVFQSCDVFVFTLGLTEVWQEKSSGIVFPTAPGTLAGDFDSEKYELINLSYEEVVADFLEFRKILVGSRKSSHAIRFLLTVSPVPLAATASNDHVMSATVHSKAILRAAAGRLATKLDDVDYFPSYELISNPWGEVCHFESDLRTVKSNSVAMVMNVFIEAHSNEKITEEPEYSSKPGRDPSFTSQGADEFLDDESIVCEEALLNAFSDEAPDTEK